MSRFSLPVPDDQNEIRTLMEAGWQLEARFGEEARMVPPPELAKLMGFRDFVRDTERHAVEVAMRAPQKYVLRLKEALEGQHEYHLHGFAEYPRGTMGHSSAFIELCEIDEALGRTCHVRSDEPEAN